METADQVQIELLPGLDPATLEAPERVSVRYDLDLRDGQLNFVMVDTTAWPPGSTEKAVMKDDNGNYALVVEKGRDRIFEFALNPEFDWSFDPESAPQGKVMTIKRGDPNLYQPAIVRPTLVEIFAKARPHPPAGGTEDHFNLYVKMGQATGLPLAIRIDPGTKNPP